MKTGAYDGPLEIQPNFLSELSDLYALVRGVEISMDMMGSGEESVVNAQLLVHGTQGLRIADASVMHKLTSSDTYSPTLMLGEFAAQLIVN